MQVHQLLLIPQGCEDLRITSPLWLVAGPNDEEINLIWANDPVHPNEAGYATLRQAFLNIAGEDLRKTTATPPSWHKEIQTSYPEWPQKAAHNQRFIPKRWRTYPAPWPLALRPLARPQPSAIRGTARPPQETILNNYDEE
jgi:hypothetical protein